MMRQRSWTEFRAGRVLGLGCFLAGSKAVSLPAEPDGLQAASSATQVPWRTATGQNGPGPSCVAMVPVEGGGTRAKDLTEEVAACSA